jgi:hypothetical protein
MSGLPILDLVIGIIFIYFLLSVISSSVLEIILTVFKIRAKVLEDWLNTIFDKPYTQPDNSKTTLGKAIMNHCSVTGLSDQDEAPSYIDAKNFSSALMEKITFDPANPQSIPSNINEFIDAIKKSTVLSTELQRVFITYAIEARETYEAVSTKTCSDIDLFRQKIENWFDTSMDRVSGKLKAKYSRRITFVIAILTAALLNADSINIAKYLYNNPDARVKLASKAYAAADGDKTIKKVETSKDKDTTKAKTTPTDTLVDTLKAKISDINKAKASLDDSLPLGWKKGELKFKDDDGCFALRLLLMKLLGLSGTVFAIMMGAPFWFDLLNKIANLRGSGTKPASKTDKKQKK